MGIGKSKVSPSIDVDDMLGAVEAERQIASEKEELEKALKELRELKSVLQMFMEDLETAIGAECKAEGALKAAADSCDNVVGGICKAIVDAEQNTVFRAEISLRANSAALGIAQASLALLSLARVFTGVSRSAPPTA